MAERERMRIVKRTQDGRRLAIEAGKRMGRKPKLPLLRAADNGRHVEDGMERPQADIENYPNERHKRNL
jgi:DNA invertase Pin-like site-specific DNA recombinase